MFNDSSPFTAGESLLDRDSSHGFLCFGGTDFLGFALSGRSEVQQEQGPSGVAFGVTQTWFDVPALASAYHLSSARWNHSRKLSHF